MKIYKITEASEYIGVSINTAMLVISGAGISGGVDREIQRARDLGIPVLFTAKDLFCEVS